MGFGRFYLVLVVTRYRTQCLLSALMGLYFGLVSAGSTAQAQDHEPAKNAGPNVLFIGVDDLNDWIGVLEGHPQARTPNIDRLCEAGMLFTRAYCAAPACNPSRVALMTGVLPSRSGVYHNNQPWKQSLADAITLPNAFRGKGYRAIGSGKMFHGSFPDPDSWDAYWPSKLNQKPTDPLPDGRPINGIPRTAHFDWGPVEAKPEEMGDSQVADWVIKQLQQEQTQPFFLACGFYRPHLPWYVPPQYFEPYPLDTIQLPVVQDDDLEDIPEAGRRFAKPNGDHRAVTNHQQWKPAVQAYLASIAFTDEMIGRVWDALQSSPYRDNTIVVFWTDHGWHLGEKKHWRKFALWEEATRTPLAIIVPADLCDQLPDGTTSRARCNQPVMLTDLYPTLVELCGLNENPQLQGRSLLPLLADPSATWERPALTTHGRGNHALRTHQYRYIVYANGEEELYDHTNDPHEFRNLAAEPSSRAIIEELSRWLPEEDAADAPRRRKK